MHLKMSMTLLILVVLCSCSTQSAEVSRTEILMGTEAQVSIKSGNSESANKVLEAAFYTLRRLEKTMNRRDPSSELTRINQHAGKVQIQVSDDILAVLLTADKVNKASGGVFDPTVGPAVRLWDEAREFPPAEEALSVIRRKIGWRLVKINSENKIISLEEGVSLDLDGIAKGYSADAAAESALQTGAQCAMVNVGGDIALKSAPSCPSWNIGISNPIDPKGRYMLSVSIRSGGIATSGPAQRYWVINHRKFPRILNPQTLLPPSQFPLSATAFAPTAAEADAWATAAVILGEAIITLQREDVPPMLVLTESRRFVFNEQWRKIFGVPKAVFP